jgi:aldose 1-epimerase
LHQKVDELTLAFNTKAEWVVNNKMIPTGETIEVDAVSGKIGRAEYDGCFTLEKPLVRLAQEGGVQLTMDCGPDFPYLQVYTPPHRNSIAIEPMTCLPDVYNNGIGLIELQPGEKRSFSFSMVLE